MEPLYEYAWLIPVFPLLGATLVGMGLIAFNQEVNRLRQLNAVFILSTIGAALVMAIALLWSQLQGHEAFLRSIEWASAGDFHLSVGYTIDHLSSLMMVFFFNDSVMF